MHLCRSRPSLKLHSAPSNVVSLKPFDKRMCPRWHSKPSLFCFARPMQQLIGSLAQQAAQRCCCFAQRPFSPSTLLELLLHCGAGMVMSHGAMYCVTLLTLLPPTLSLGCAVACTALVLEFARGTVASLVSICCLSCGHQELHKS